MHIGDTIVDCRMAWVRGSRESTNNAGLKGQPWRADLDTGNKEEVHPVKTRAEGLEYITLIIPMKVLPKPSPPRLTIRMTIQVKNQIKDFIVAYTKLLQCSEILRTWPATSTQYTADSRYR